MLWEEAQGPSREKAGTGLRPGWALTRPRRSLSRDRKSGVRQLLTRGQRFLWRPEEQEAQRLGGGDIGNTEAWVPGQRAYNKMSNQPPWTNKETEACERTA